MTEPKTPYNPAEERRAALGGGVFVTAIGTAILVPALGGGLALTIAAAVLVIGLGIVITTLLTPAPVVHVIVNDSDVPVADDRPDHHQV